jgi:hypothetical protein
LLCKVDLNDDLIAKLESLDLLGFQ